MYDERLDGIRSYDLAIKTARSKILEPTEEKLWTAIKTLRACNVTVLLSEGEGISSLFDVGGMKRIGYYEVLRQAKKACQPSPDESLRPLKEWPVMAKDAFR